jgi:hypothetical protein
MKRSVEEPANAAGSDSMLATFSKLVVDAGFADQCLLESCVPDTHDARDGEPPRSVSILRIPLVARGAVIGAMSLVRFGTPYTRADRELGEVLGGCAALIAEREFRPELAKLTARIVEGLVDLGRLLRDAARAGDVQLDFSFSEDPSAVADFGAALRRARQKRGWTPSHLAAVTGLSREQVEALERGTLRLPVTVARRLFEALRIDADVAHAESKSRGSGFFRRRAPAPAAAPRTPPRWPRRGA